ncbi:autotransporter outer membrane beta-barrel domain-containing protein, partial [Pseudomonas sp. dw_358]|uniref:autotransporter outer membrane beta-barrel domain-containing protein n=1 Tax=Pseudomonas sp. dw_358 TaxID=2720083 RepID=UPI001BD22556
TEALDATHFGKLVVTGTATLPDQAKFDVDVVNSGQSFQGATLASVLSAGTLNSNGTYAVTSNSALYNFSGVKDGNSVDLVAAPKTTTAVTNAVAGISTANLSAARVLDSAIATNSSLTPFFVGATSGSSVASAISQTLPSNAAAATEVSQSTLSTIADVVQSRIDANTGLASGDGFYGDKNLWMKPFGSWINQSQHGNTPGYDATVYGMAFGLDAPVNELLRLGVSFSYANADTNSKADVSAQSAKVDLYQLMGYGSYTVAPNTELSFHAGVGQNRNDGKRDLSLNGISGQAKSNYDSRTVTAGVALAKAYDISPTTRFIPSVRADYTWLKDDSYHESGSAAINPLLLDVDQHQTDQLILGLDGKLVHEVIPGTQLTANLGVGYDVIHDDSMLTSSYAGAAGNTFNTVGQSSSPWLARGGVGVTTRIAQNGTELSVNYDAEA